MLTCEFVFPDREKERYEDVESVSLPARSGRMEVLPGHAEAFVVLVSGEIVVRTGEGEPRRIGVPGGECFVHKDVVMVIS